MDSTWIDSAESMDYPYGQSMDSTWIDSAVHGLSMDSQEITEPVI
jgi:hypothetical protein